MTLLIGKLVIEDAAQGVMAKFEERYLGTHGNLGTLSFHNTKNLTSGGEGGLLVVNDPQYIDRAEILREKGTNRKSFQRGETSKYTWVDIGSSYLASELQAAYLYGQLMFAERITSERTRLWDLYNSELADLERIGCLTLPKIPNSASHNGHIYHIRTHDRDVRDNLISYLRSNGIFAVFHYIPLHNSPAGKVFGRFHGKDNHTTFESERLIRLPLWFGMTIDEIEFVADRIKKFFHGR
jgi:dTDP-4-amino-4,6-dideoxygalactose transaminase